MDSKELSKFLPVLPALYNTAAYQEWMEYFKEIGTEPPLSFLEVRKGRTVSEFLLFSPIQAMDKGKIPLMILSKEVTPNVTLYFQTEGFRDFFRTLKNIKAKGVIVTDSSEEGKKLNSGLKGILSEEKNKDWMIEEVEEENGFLGIEGVCGRYDEMVEKRESNHIEYGWKRQN